jgi:FAD/FMN-containing dehydrogenase
LEAFRHGATFLAQTFSMSQSQTPHLNTPSADLLARLVLIVGTEHAVLDPVAQQPYLKEWRDLYIGRTPLILRPGSTEEVSQVLALANEARVAIVPQGGNTGLVGGQIPNETGSEIVLSLNRMTRIRSVDAAGMSLTVEAGATLADVR